jgi:hypothetical protein
LQGHEVKEPGEHLDGDVIDWHTGSLGSLGGGLLQVPLTVVVTDHAAT